MMKMLIQFDENKTSLLNNQYSLANVWKLVDDAFAKFACIRESQPNGSVMYYENPHSEDSYCDFSSILIELASNALVVSVCSKWIWYDDEENDAGVFDEEDVLAQVNDFKFCKLAYNASKKNFTGNNI